MSFEIIFILYDTVSVICVCKVSGSMGHGKALRSFCRLFCLFYNTPIGFSYFFYVKIKLITHSFS